jgi:peptidoglycan biosynthesis protein MviN/MurJ (putative lipid II flippase)
LLPALIPLRSDPRKFSLLWLNSSAAAAAIVMPALLLFTVAPGPLLTRVFLSRQFNAGAITIAASTLASYGPAMLGLLMRDCCIPGLLALGCEQAVMVISGVGFAVNILVKAVATVQGHPGVIAFASGAGLLTCGAGLLILLCCRMRVFKAADFSLLRAVIGASLVAGIGGWVLRHWSTGMPAREAALLFTIPVLYAVTLMLAYPPLFPFTKFARRSAS